MEIEFKNVSTDDLSCHIKEGKINFIVGGVNSGKSLFLSLVNDEILDGKEISKVGFLRQNPEKYFFCNTIYDEVLFTLKKYKLKVSDKKIVDSLKIVGLDESYLSRSPLKISTGEQKKLALALVLAVNPKVLLLDEPFKGLDFTSKKMFIKLFRKMKMRYNRTILIASVDVDDALQFADYVICLKNGSLIFQGDKFDLFTNNKLLKESNIPKPQIIKFTDSFKEGRKVNIGYRDDINDLMKDIYRVVR